MHLATPAALWLLALLPLLLLARRRVPRSRLRVSHLPLWNAATTRQAATPSRRRRHDWLLLLQACILAGLILALAGPHAALPGHAIAIVIDVSMSMGASDRSQSRIDTARSQALDHAAGLPRGTLVHLLAASGDAAVIGAFDAHESAFRRAVERLRTTGGFADLTAAIQRAQQLTPRPERIAVFSDAKAEERRAGTADVEWFQVGAPLGNLAVSALTSRPATDGRSFDTLVEVRNFSASPVRTTVTIAQGATTLFREPLSIPAQGRARVAPELPLHPGQVVTASIDRGDALATDDTRSAIVPFPEDVPIELRGGSVLLERALASRPGVRVHRADASNPSSSRQADIVVCDGCQNVPSGEAGVILVPPRPGVSDGTRRPSPGDSRAVPMVIKDDAFPMPADLDGAFVVPIPAERQDVRGVVASAGGIPVIVAYELGTRRVVELRFDPDTSPLSRTAGLPLLLAAALDWASVRLRNPTTATAGSAVRWVLPAGSTASVDGPEHQVVPARVSDGHLIMRPDVPGLYRVRIGDKERTLVASPDVQQESDLTNAAFTSGTTPLPRNDNGLLTDVSRWLAAGVLLLLALEWQARQQRRA